MLKLMNSWCVCYLMCMSANYLMWMELQFETMSSLLLNHHKEESGTEET